MYFSKNTTRGRSIVSEVVIAKDIDPVSKLSVKRSIAVEEGHSEHNLLLEECSQVRYVDGAVIVAL
jgi:hypothetical protein